MQKLSSGIGDLKKLTFIRSSSDMTEQPAAPRIQRSKVRWLVVAILLTWGVLHVALSEILSTRPHH